MEVSELRAIYCCVEEFPDWPDGWRINDLKMIYVLTRKGQIDLLFGSKMDCERAIKSLNAAGILTFDQADNLAEADDHKFMQIVCGDLFW